MIEDFIGIRRKGHLNFQALYMLIIEDFGRILVALFDEFKGYLQTWFSQKWKVHSVPLHTTYFYTPGKP